jgi:uncharacterized protein with HEPN domain
MPNTKERSPIEYLGIMQRAAADAIRMIEGMDQATFEKSKVTFSAVSFCHFLVGQSASDLMRHHPEFATDHPQLPWAVLSTMRDHVLNDFFDISPEEIWFATLNSMRDLELQIADLRNWRAQGE